MAMAQPDSDDEEGEKSGPRMKITTVINPVEFEIQPLTFGDTSETDREEIMEFVEKANRLSRSVNAASRVASEAQTQIDAIETVIGRTPNLDPEMQIDLREIEERLMDVREKFNGDPTKSRRNEMAYPGFMSRLRTMMFGAMGSTTGPTGTHRAQYDIVLAEYEEVIDDLRKIIEDDLPAMNEKLDDAGAPWTPGRGIPDLDDN